MDVLVIASPSKERKSLWTFKRYWWRNTNYKTYTCASCEFKWKIMNVMVFICQKTPRGMMSLFTVSHNICRICVFMTALTCKYPKGSEIFSVNRKPLLSLYVCHSWKTLNNLLSVFQWIIKYASVCLCVVICSLPLDSSRDFIFPSEALPLLSFFTDTLIFWRSASFSSLVRWIFQNREMMWNYTTSGTIEQRAQLLSAFIAEGNVLLYCLSVLYFSLLFHRIYTFSCKNISCRHKAV